MGWKKRGLLEEAFAEIGIAAYDFDLKPEEVMTALRRMDGMMAEWNSVGIRIGYALPSGDGQSDPDQMSGVTDEALEAIRTNLAMRIAPGFGKTVSVDTKIAAAKSYAALLSRCSDIVQAQVTNLPLGAGYKPWLRYSPFSAPAVDEIAVGPDADLSL